MDGQLPSGADADGSALIFLLAISGDQHNILHSTQDPQHTAAATDSLLPTFPLFQCRVCI